MGRLETRKGRKKEGKKPKKRRRPKDGFGRMTDWYLFFGVHVSVLFEFAFLFHFISTIESFFVTKLTMPPFL